MSKPHLHPPAQQQQQRVFLGYLAQPGTYRLRPALPQVLCWVVWDQVCRQTLLAHQQQQRALGVTRQRAA
jgi:hypothetical protein